MASFNEADERVLPLILRSNGGFAIGSQWYLKGWKPLPYQWAWHHAPHMSTTAMWGIAAGKTTIAAASLVLDALSIPYFRALATSVTAVQAELTFQMFLGWYEDNSRLQHLIKNVRLRPYPVVEFMNYSKIEWRTSGTDAENIRGSEYDRALLDEGGLDLRGYVAKVLRGRLRGTRPNGLVRMSRLDVITSPTDAPWLRERFEKGDKDHPTYDPNYLSMRIETYDNTKLTPQQIAAMEADYPSEMIDVELRGKFPDFGVSMFPSGHVYACADVALYERAREGVQKSKKGFDLHEDPRHGLYKFELPRVPEGQYILAGDPGTDNPPRRNAATIGVVRIDVKPHQLVYFEWVSGKGSYRPFLSRFRYCIEKYNPIVKGFDSTGPQKAINELAFETEGIIVEGLSFSHQKEAFLNALSLWITGHEITYPPIKGLLRQLTIYTRESDSKIPQDITMLMAMLAHLTRHATGMTQERPRAQSAGFRSSPKRRRFRGRS